MDVRAGGRRAGWLRRSRRAQIGTGKGYDLLSGATIDLGERAQLRMDEETGRDIEAELRAPHFVPGLPHVVILIE